MRKIELKKPGKHVIELKKPGKHVIELTHEGEEVEIVGIFETKDEELMEVEVIIHHRASSTQATTTLKGVARDKSQLKFKGRIIIDKNCGQSNSFLTERILLLSDQAYGEVTPNLEILTDDVKCSHAATISNISEENLFYLMSRGLSKKKAEELIVDGFLR
ncbi:SufD family Fe-S cluster assembly protein [Patescibacteria group bacterium]|nr:SufD family Fe-S cluster assembly protein [Patescibacteria group bacterium]MBU1885747.1 SufD family Fe-S cluster assembly protein [Patescibacteria group bacterium]